MLAKGDGTIDDYRRILGVNVDGVVFGVQALTPRMSAGSVFVVTASLAGLMPMESDPLYVLTKHAVVGYARSMAPVLEPRGIRINLICPGIVRTPMTEPAQADLDAAGFPLMEPEQIAQAALLAARSEETGQAWVCQPGREPLKFKFPNVPGPRVEAPRAWSLSSDRPDGTCRGQDPTTSQANMSGPGPLTSRGDVSRRIERR